MTRERSFAGRYARLRALVEQRLAALGEHGTPRGLRDACRYVLTGGGKRVRAVLVLLACEATGGRARDALDAGVAVEIMHNFTLVHDDIMDNARTRRGRPTVHLRWGVNTALLVGDVLLAKAYMNLLRTPTLHSVRLARLFTRGVVEVCEGQALDMEFEGRRRVSVDDYYGMIEKKTGRLIATSAELGAIIGGGTPADVRALRWFGHHLGRAFQLQDDLLDVVADEVEFGKAIGGDIVEGKRTFLLVRAVQRARGRDREFLRGIMLRTRKPALPLTPAQRRRLVASVTGLYARYGVLKEAAEEVRKNTHKAVQDLRRLRPTPARDMLAWLADELVNRNS
jgi:geranylgeranyl diphosphate synthase type II